MWDLRAACRQGCQWLGSPGGRIHLLWLFCLQCHSHAKLPQCGGQWGWQLRGQPSHPLLPPGQLQSPNPEPPELQHHVTWDLPGRGGGRGHLLPLHLMPTSCSAPCGSRPEAKEKFIPCFWFFSSMFFSKRSYFLQWFYTEGKREQKSLCLSPQSLPCFLCVCLKTPGLLHGAQGEDAIIGSSFVPLPWPRALPRTL